MPALAQPSPEQRAAVEAARAYRATRGAEILNDFGALLAIPNTALDAANIERNAEYIHFEFKRRGVRTELLKVHGAPPLIYGVIKTPGATRTLGLYAHYDGQPLNHERWTQPPWEPTLYTGAIRHGGRQRPFPAEDEPIDPDWRIYARSASDDKAPFAALLAALDALHEANIPLSSHIKFLFDGEEERSSPHLPQYLDLYGDPYEEVDTWLLLDGPVHQTRRPQIAFGVRGITSMEVTVYGPSHPLHSGHYSNWAPVPGAMLSHLLASMIDADGHVLIDGFYDRAAPIGPTEQEAIDEMPVQDEVLRREFGLVHTEDSGARLIERLMLPSLTVKGLESGGIGARARNVIPAFATASLGLRLVKGNDPKTMLDLIEAHIRKQGYHIVRVTPVHETRLKHPKIARVIRQKGYPAARTSMDLPVVPKIEAAVEAAIGRPPIRVPTLGASMPLHLFTDVLGKPALIIPIANHDNNQHAADENIRIANLWYGMDLYAALLTM